MGDFMANINIDMDNNSLAKIKVIGVGGEIGRAHV